MEDAAMVGYTIEAKAGKDLKGKVTLPNEYQELPILEIGNFTTNLQISHIFIKSDSQIRKINNNAFFLDAKGAVQLDYFDFVPSIVEIGDYAFKYVPLKPDSSHSYILPKNLKTIGAHAFNQGLYITEPITIVLPASLEALKTFAFSNLK
jgi:hypothetical protein